MNVHGASVPIALLAFAAGCAPLVQYSDELVEPRTGRSEFVIWPATAGGVVGFVVGVPIDIVGFPVTWGIYRIQKSSNPFEADLPSVALFPSFVLWRAGAIVLGLPFDAIEYGLYRAWLPPEAMNRDARETLELELDEATLPMHPVQPLYGITGSEPESRPGTTSRR